MLRRWVGFGVLALLGCGATEPRWDVVLVVADTLRADHMSLYGYDRATTPRLDEISRESVVFRNVLSQAGCTFPSVASLLTSRYPGHFIGDGVRMSMPEHTTPLAEILLAAGWSTAAVSASPIIRVTPTDENTEGGYGRGFDRFDETCEWGDARCVNRQAFQTIDETDGALFLYLHYVDPHQPYQPPRGYNRQFSRQPTGREFVREGNIRPLVETIHWKRRHIELEPEELDHLVALYDDEIRFLDSELGRLVQHLRKAGRWERTLFILASDHGEELMDHESVSHCHSLVWGTVLNTPLLMRIPGQESAVVDRAAQNIDIVPTILDYLGVPRDDLFEGKSLRPAIEQGAAINRYQFAAQGLSRTVSDDQFKLIFDLETQTTQLYDLSSDPTEKTDVVATFPTEAERLAAVLEAWMLATESGVSQDDAARRAKELEEHLEAVGYF